MSKENLSRPDFCPECGTKLKRGMKFCPKCGTSILSWYEDEETEAAAPADIEKDEPVKEIIPEPVKEVKSEPVKAAEPEPVKEAKSEPAREAKIETPKKEKTENKSSKSKKPLFIIIGAAVIVLLLIMVMGMGKDDPEPVVKPEESSEALISSEAPQSSEAPAAEKKEIDDFEVKTKKDKEGRLIEEKAYLDDGTPVKRTYNYHDDKLSYIEDFFKSGVIAHRAGYNDDEVKSYEWWYDENANLICSKNFVDGEFYSGQYSVFGDNNKEIVRFRFDENNNKEETREFIYEDGMLVRIDFFDEDDNLCKYEIYEHDSEGRFTNEMTFQPDGRITALYINEYSERATVEKLYNRDGELRSISTITYDENGIYDSSEYHSKYDSDWKEYDTGSIDLSSFKAPGVRSQKPTVKVDSILPFTPVKKPGEENTEVSKPVEKPEESKPEESRAEESKIESEKKEEGKNPFEGRDSDNYYDVTKLGSFEGSTYINEYLGIKLDLPGYENSVPDFYKAPEADDEALTETKQNYWTTSQMFLDLNSMNSSDNSVQVIYTIIPRNQREYMINEGEKALTEAYAGNPEALAQAKEAEAANGTELLSTEAVAADFAGTERYGLLQLRNFGGKKLYGYRFNFPELTGRYSITFSLSAPTMEELDALLASVKPLN